MTEYVRLQPLDPPGPRASEAERRWYDIFPYTPNRAMRRKYFPHARKTLSDALAIARQVNRERHGY